MAAAAAGSHMQASGFAVSATNVTPDEMDRVKATANVSPGAASCHTAFVDGYVIEGHVPASDVARLFSERPDAIGLAAPGMPGGSPGMEAAAAEPYDVLLIRRDGRTEVYATTEIVGVHIVPRRRPMAAWAAARRAIGTRNGEQDT